MKNGENHENNVFDNEHLTTEETANSRKKS